MLKQTKIRCSGLPHYSDCPRKAAAKLLLAELVEDGYQLHTLKTSVGAAVGTATHAGIETALLLRQEGKDYEKELEEVATLSIESSIENGVLWDLTTPTKDIAIKQAIRQAKSVVNNFPDLTGVDIEEEYKADLGDNFILSGHIDIRHGDAIFDIKTGATRRANQAQYGGYSLLCRSNGKIIKRLGEIYVPRIGITKPQPEPQFVEYDVKDAERLAWDIIQQIKKDILSYRENKSARTWLANPNSMMCNPDYCPAYKTNFCNCQIGDIKNDRRN